MNKNKEDLAIIEKKELDDKQLVDKIDNQLFKSLDIMSKKLSEIFSEEFLQTVEKIGKYVANVLSKIDIPKISDIFNEAYFSKNYIDALNEYKWPLYLINDEKFQHEIINAYIDNQKINKVEPLIYNLLDEKFIEALLDDWKHNLVIKNDRKPILKEAIFMHNNGYYISSTSILMCQIYGIISDITDILKSNKFKLSEDEVQLILNRYDMKIDNIDSEKGKLFQCIFVAEDKVYFWNAIMSYFKKDVLCSSNSKQKWKTQPLRNKICHGDQLNFGTKQHSLKSILAIDLLIQLSAEIDRVCNTCKI